MIDLEKNFDLPISLIEDGLLEFRPPLEQVKPSHRTIQDMRDYLADPDATFNKESVYDMYRAVHLPQDEKNFQKAGLRYDITVFHPGLLGSEFSKTIGHFHALKSGTQIQYPEMYQVIRGTAHFLIQKNDNKSGKISAVYLIEVKEGEKVIFPPGFGHVTINTQNSELVTANWVEVNFQSDYNLYKKNHGAAYYVLSGDNGKIKIVPNQNYLSLPILKKLRPKELPKFGLIFGQPMYQTGQKSPDMLQFLIEPELFLQELTIENCYSPA